MRKTCCIDVIISQAITQNGLEQSTISRALQCNCCERNGLILRIHYPACKLVLSMQIRTENNAAKQGKKRAKRLPETHRIV